MTTTTQLDYLQRTRLNLASLNTAPVTSAPAALRYLWRIHSIGRPGKHTPKEDGDQQPQLPTAALLAGIHAYRLPIGVLGSGSAEGVTLALGGWEPTEGYGTVSLKTHSKALNSALVGLYPGIRCTEMQTAITRPELCG